MGFPVPMFSHWTIVMGVTNRLLQWLLIAGCLLDAACMAGRASANASEILAEKSSKLFVLKTLGGPTNWTDQAVHGDWRVQQNVDSGQYRLLDPRNRRLASGTFEHCFQQLELRRLRGEIAPMPRHVVIVMHGLAGTRHWMDELSDYLREKGGYTVLNVGYASRKGTIQQHTVALESVLRKLIGVEEVSFVCHSMSNIMVRHLLYRFQVCGNPPPLVFRRMVMISPPNHGACLADSLGQRHWIAHVMGEVVDQFAPSKDWPALERQLVTPWFEFGILAGGRGNDGGYSRAIPGDDDGLLSVQTHMLTGARDFCQVGGLHPLMPKLEKTQQSTLRFLNCGHF